MSLLLIQKCFMKAKVHLIGKIIILCIIFYKQVCKKGSLHLTETKRNFKHPLISPISNMVMQKCSMELNYYK